jgi:hypothetical protein
LRAQLKAGLAPVSSAIIDHIDEFDERRDKGDRNRLCESARLAPEHFVPPLVDYIFELTEVEPWFAEAGLTILRNIGADPMRLARVALLTIGNTPAARTAAGVLLDYISYTDSTLVTQAL